MSILSRELDGKQELTYIKESFTNLVNDEISVDIELNLERLKEFKEKVNYKRNVPYFVINNIVSTTSKYDINTRPKKILTSDTLKVLRYDYPTRLYTIVEPIDKMTKVKLLDIKNNVIPNTNTLSLFANILDLGLGVLN